MGITMNKFKYTVSIDTWLMLGTVVASSLASYVSTGSFLDVYTAVFATGAIVMLKLDKERKSEQL
jgi:hypothetical protein